MANLLDFNQFENGTLVTDFLESYPNVQVAKENLWEIVLAAMGSEHADMWDRKTRADKLFFYEQVSALLEFIYQAHKQEN